jgi:protein-L-isoaspartate(D-aspartate) O-methyltransferase
MDQLSDNCSLFAAARNRMVREQLADLPPRVLAAMGKVPRHEFVPRENQLLAYANMPLPIGYGQSISQPYIVALMTAQLDPQPDDRVLEIGTGSGYQVAVLAELVAEVYTIEIIEPLALRARAELQKLGCQNVHLRIGDGFAGWPEAAPFDAIIATCAPQQVPPPLIEQLGDGGRLVIPVGMVPNQELILFHKTRGRLETHPVVPVRFVPMTGEGGNPGCFD